MSNISRARGDTRRIQRTVKENGVAINITGWTFTLTISREEDPSDTSEEVATIAGVIVVAGDGTVKFTPTLPDVDWVGNYFFDIEAVDTDGGISTLDKGRWSNTQDITKSDEVFEWTPDEAHNDDDPVSFDGSEAFYIDNGYGVALPTYQTRDSRRVIRRQFDNSASQWTSVGLMPRGPEFHRVLFYGYGWEFKITVFINLAMVSLEINDGPYTNTFYPNVNVKTGTAAADLPGSLLAPDNVTLVDNDGTPTDLSGESNDWYVIGIRIATSGLVYGCTVKEGDAEEWIQVNDEVWPPGQMNPLRLSPFTYCQQVHPFNAAALVDLWKYEYRRLT